MIRIFAFACALLAPAAAMSQDYRSDIGLKVRAIDASHFVVAGTPSSSAKTYWCAASEFLRDSSRNLNKVRITVVDPVGSIASDRRDVGFSIAADADKGSAASASISVTAKGANLSLALAAEFCSDLRRQENGL